MERLFLFVGAICIAATIVMLPSWRDLYRRNVDDVRRRFKH